MAERQQAIETATGRTVKSTCPLPTSARGAQRPERLGQAPDQEAAWDGNADEDTGIALPLNGVQAGSIQREVMSHRRGVIPEADELEPTSALPASSRSTSRSPKCLPSRIESELGRFARRVVDPVDHSSVRAPSTTYSQKLFYASGSLRVAWPTSTRHSESMARQST